MTLHDWEKHMTAKGITHNDAVRMLKDAEAEIEQLRVMLALCIERITEDNENRAALNAYNAGLGVSEWQALMPEVWHTARRVLGEATS